MLHAPAPGRARFGIWLRLSLLATNLLVLGVSLWPLSANLRRYREQASVTTNNLAVILEQNLSGHIRLIDLALLQLLDNPAVAGRSMPAPAALARILEQQRARVPLLSALRVTDGSGRIIGGTPWPGSDLETIADRPFFRQLREQGSDALVISPPVAGRSGQPFALLFARARRDDAGRFLGALFGVVPLQAFDSTLGVVDTGPHGSIAVRDGDHRLVTRHPRTPDQEARIGQNVSTPEYLEIVKSPEGVGTFRKPSPVDGAQRTWTVRRVAGRPFNLVIGLAESDYLAPWRRECVKAAATILGSLLLTSILGHLLMKAWRHHQSTQWELAQEKEKFQILTEQTDDVIWALTPEGTFSYVSPAIFRQRGFTPEEFTRMPPLQGLTEPAASLFLEALRTRPPADPAHFQEVQTLDLELRRKDGGTFPAEVQFTVLRDAAGQVLGIRGMTRDVTERRRVHQEMEGLIGNLRQALAEVKELKGLLPICSGCKKIRDDQGYWNQMETYISHHTDATFTHGLCPECVKEYFPEMVQARLDRETGAG